jgi:hypothetical protein
MNRIAGLYQLIFRTYEAAIPNLRFLGWVEEGRSVPKGAKVPSEVRYFNKFVGGSGRLFEAEDGWVFLAADGWLMKVYKVLHARGVLRSPSEDARLAKVEAAASTPERAVLDLFGDE